MKHAWAATAAAGLLLCESRAASAARASSSTHVGLVWRLPIRDPIATCGFGGVQCLVGALNRLLDRNGWVEERKPEGSCYRERQIAFDEEFPVR